MQNQRATATAITVVVPAPGETVGDFAFDLHHVWDTGPLGPRHAGVERRTHREVLITLVRPDLCRQPGFEERFREEMILMGRITHPNVVRTIGSGVYGDRLFYAAEKIPLEPLIDYARKGIRFSTEEIVHIGQGICRALLVAGSFGIVPVQPRASNVSLSPEGTVKLSDLGLARILESVGGMEDFGRSWASLSPEKARGEKPGGASDLYALGVLLYELAVGKPPFEGFESRTSLVFQVLNTVPASPRDAGSSISRDLERVILSCLAKDPEDRPEDPESLLKELDCVRDNLRSVPALPSSARDETGDFEIFEDQMLAQGGMGTLFLGRQRSLDRKVAIKVIRDVHSDDAEFRNRFQSEAELLAQIRDGHVVQVFGAGAWKGRPFYAMELVEGADLGARLAKGPAFTIPDVLQVAQGIGSALRAAWKFNVVHRDIKPANILWTADGTVKLTDFGLAKSVRIRRHDSQYILGTLGYLSPEQAKGLSVDVRSDLYSLGVVLYELATGHLPASPEGSGTTLLREHDFPAIAPSSTEGVPPGLVEVIRRCMARSPAERFQTPEEFLDAVDDLIRGGAPEKAPVPAPAANGFRDAHCFQEEEPGPSLEFQVALGLGDHRRALDLALTRFGKDSPEVAAAQERARAADLQATESQALEKFRSRDWQGALDLYRSLVDRVPDERRSELRKVIDFCVRLQLARALEAENAFEDAMKVYSQIRLRYDSLCRSYLDERECSVRFKLDR